MTLIESSRPFTFGTTCTVAAPIRVPDDENPFGQRRPFDDGELDGHRRAGRRRAAATAARLRLAAAGGLRG